MVLLRGDSEDKGLPDDPVILNPEVVMDMVQVSFQLPREVLSALRQHPKGFLREMRLAAAVKWVPSVKKDFANDLRISLLPMLDGILRRFTAPPQTQPALSKLRQHQVIPQSA
jgi:hypothetical protein